MGHRRPRSGLVLSDIGLVLFDLASLFLIGFELHGLFFFFLLDCFPEAASVFCDLAKCNVDDRVGDSLQKIIVVRNDHETSFKTVQIIDQPLYMLRIKVVRRFVQ